MTLNKLYILACICGAAYVSSCSSDGYWEKYTPKADSYSFVQSAVTFESFDDLSVIVTRSNAASEIVVPIVYAGDTELIGGPAEVKFESGKTSATVQLTCDASKVTPGDKAAVTISLPADNVESYNIASITATVAPPLTWISMGKGTWSSTMLGAEWPVDVFKADGVVGRYSIVNPLDEKDSNARMEFTVNDTYTEAKFTPFFPQAVLSDYYLYFRQATNDDGVAIPNTVEGNNINFAILWGACTEAGNLESYAGSFGSSIETVTMPDGWK